MSRVDISGGYFGTEATRTPNAGPAGLAFGRNEGRPPPGEAGAAGVQLRGVELNPVVGSRGGGNRQVHCRPHDPCRHVRVRTKSGFGCGNEKLTRSDASTESVRSRKAGCKPCRTTSIAVRMRYGPPGGQGLWWRRNRSPPPRSSPLGPRYSVTAMNREGYVVRALPRDSRSPSTTSVVMLDSRSARVDGASPQDEAPFPFQRVQSAPESFLTPQSRRWKNLRGHLRPGLHKYR